MVLVFFKGLHETMLYVAVGSYVVIGWANIRHVSHEGKLFIG